MKRVLNPRNLLWILLLLFAAWSLVNVPLNQVSDILRSIRIGHFVLLALINIIIFSLFSSRWWLIIRARGYKPGYFSLVGYRLVSFGISYFTPGTQFGGEPLQVYMLEKEHSIPASGALATVSLDKLFEMLGNFTFLLIGVITITISGLLPSLGSPIVIVGAIALFGIPLIYLSSLWFGASPIATIYDKLLQSTWNSERLIKISTLLKETEIQISWLLKHSPMTVFWVISLTALIWFLMLGEYWLAVTILGADISLAQAVMALTAARIAFLTPTPGGLGALEASQMFALSALGFSSALGISLSLLIRARDISFGLAGLWWGAVLTKRTASAKAAAPYLEPGAAKNTL